MSMRAVVFTFAALILAILALHIPPARADWESAGPMWHDYDAQRKCPSVCGPDYWDGIWKTVGKGNAACFCTRRASEDWSVLGPYGQRICIETYPIRNKLEAQMICPGACGSGKWDGSWRRIDRGRASCGCKWRQPLTYDAIEAAG